MIIFNIIDMYPMKSYYLITIAKKSYTNFSELNILIDYNLCHITLVS